MGEKPEKPEAAEDRFFYIKIPETPQVRSADAEKTEQELLARLKDSKPRAETLKPLAIFYSRVGRQERAYHFLKMWLKAASSKQESAECLLMCGQLAEQLEQAGPAARFYREGLKQASGIAGVDYFLHNNLAFCLNALSVFAEAIQHGRAAVALDPSRANAYKNLGISQAGLGQWVEAARSWLQAMHADASDQRSLELLEKAWMEQREIIALAIPDMPARLEACRRATATANIGRFSDWARGLTLN